METLLITEKQIQSKWVELNKLNLFGFNCYMRKPIKNKNNTYLYFFQKEISKGCFVHVVSKFVDIEFCLLHQISLSNVQINKLTN